ncbi:MAG: hypothetical protein CM15mL1_2100 [Libanvirus sp.]|jgi:hypothetical protein|nr:MAG: hypothetical protein CM15mL1_2100 [Libanvirus sp.]|tara:strand:+ start:689 stop:943 length:255 start_codon:yes stop_codon:yes gene_type:complete
MRNFDKINYLKELQVPVIDDNAGTISVTFTFDELHAFSEHVDWCIYEQDQPVNDNLQSFIDKLLYNKRNTAPKIKQVNLPKEEW